MNATQLRAAHEAAHPDSHFFTRRSMAFFGDTMSNYAVSSEPVSFLDYSGDKMTCWELRRKRAVKHGLKAPAYFCAETFRKVSRPEGSPDV